MQLVEERLRSLMLPGLAGDAAAYRIFLDELAAHLRSYLRRRLRGLPDEVEDLLQESSLPPAFTHAEPCPDAATLGGRRERVRGGSHRCARIYPALPRAGSAVSRHLVPARYADPHRHRRVARSAAASLVARLPENCPTVTF